MSTTELSTAEQDPAIVADERVTDASEGTFGFYPLWQIRISRTNRTRFNSEKMAELVKSVKAKGVIQPILMRPITPTEEDPCSFEIVAGERRFRASELANLNTIPAVVRVLTDAQAAEIQVIENLQREDVHPLEEAMGYQELMMKHGYDADQLAEKISKSRSYIYGRLKLCALTPDAREFFFDDKLPASTALLVARIPVPSLQVKAVREILRIDSTYEQEPMSYRSAVQFVQNRYMLNLEDAPFSATDAKLLATAGSCAKCPKRTGNQPEIFTDVSSADVCTDPDCFSEKRAANDANILAAAHKKGIPVLEGDDATTMRQSNDTVLSITGMWKFERCIPEISNSKRVESLLNEKQLPPPKAYIKLGEGHVHAAYSKSAVQVALEKAGICETIEAHTARMSEKMRQPEQIEKLAQQKAQAAAQQELENKAEAETKFRVTLYKKLRERGQAGFSVESLRTFVKLILRDDNGYPLPIDLLGDVYPFDGSSDDNTCAYIDQASLEEVQLLLVDLALGGCLGVSRWQIERDDPDEDEGLQALLDMARHEGIDPDEVRKSIETPQQEAPVTAPQAKKASKKKAEQPAAQATNSDTSSLSGEAKISFDRAAAWPFPRSSNSAATTPEAA